MNKSRMLAAVSALFMAVLAATAHASLVVPTGLNPGDTYHVIFVSSTVRDATSANIADYDAHVQAAANTALIGASLGISWRAVVSTPTINAIDHLAPLFTSTSTVPIYNQYGKQVSNSYDALWDGAIDTPILYDEQTTAVEGRPVWTGTRSNGLGYPTRELGGVGPGTQHGATTTLSVLGEDWIDFFKDNQRQLFNVYGLSTEIAVPGIPVPPAVWLFGSGLLGLFGVAKR